MEEKNTYRVSLVMTIVEALMAYLIYLMMNEAYLATLLKQLGISDTLTGLISSLTGFSCSAQLVMLFIYKPESRVKKLIIATNIIPQISFIFLYCMPWFNMPQTLKTVLFAGLFLIANFVMQATAPAKGNWHVSLVPEYMRGEFQAKKEIVSLVGQMIFIYIMGRVTDGMRSAGMAKESMLVCAGVILFLSVGQIISLVLIKEPVSHSDRKKVSFSDSIKMTLGTKPFRNLCFLSVLWKFSIGVSTVYYGVYQIKELGFSLTFVSFLAFIYGIARMSFSMFFGRYADKNSWAKMFTICFSIASASFFVNIFTTPSNGHVLFSIYYALFAISMAGINNGLINCFFDYMSPESITYSMSISGSIGGLASILGAALGGLILNRIQKLGGFQILGFNLYAQQVLSAITFALVLLCVIYSWRRTSKLRSLRAIPESK